MRHEESENRHPMAQNQPEMSHKRDFRFEHKNLKNGVYSNTAQFAADVRKIWSNSFLYNGKDTPISVMTKEMSNLFERLFKEAELNLGPVGGEINQLQKQVEKLSKEIKDLHQKGSKPSRNQKASNQLDKPMSINENSPII